MPTDALKIKFGIDTKNWISPAIVLFSIIAGFMAFHWDTVASLGRYWTNDFTYGHGLLVAPLSLFLIWRKRAVINAVGYTPSFFGVILFLFLNLIWLTAYLIDVEVVQQYDLLAMVAVLCLALLGWRNTYHLSFPLLFPLIAMPLWSWLEPVLQFVTTQVVAACLSLVGVPVFVETHFIRIPEGEFSIEEVCAGLRYLLSAIAISLVYAHLHMKKIKTAFLFVGFSILLSLMVNWIRVFSVIVAGHLTNMQHSLIRDHADFGWWLFAFTLIPIFWFGNYLLNREQRDFDGPNNASVAAVNHSNDGSHIRYILISVLTIAVVVPLFAHYLKIQSKKTIMVNISAPVLSAGWQGPYAPQDYLKPHFQGADASYSANYSKNGQKVFFYTAGYLYQEQGKELISWNNHLFDQKLWTIASKSTRQITLNSENNESLRIEENVVRNPLGKRQILWHWYSVAGVNTVKPVIAKALIIKDIIAKNKMGSHVILLACDADAGVDQARDYLTEFLQETRNIPGLHNNKGNGVQGDNSPVTVNP